MRARGWQIAAARAICFVVPAVCAADYTVNHFYRAGAEVWDSGWFAWLSTHATAWPMPNPLAIGGRYLATHFAPIFFLLTAVHRLMPHMPSPVWFALSQGLWFGLLGLACALCATPRLVARPALGAVLGLLAAGNGIALATVGFPHYEIAASALLFLAIALHRRSPWWPAPLLLMLLVREDAGLHAALAFAALAVLRGRAARNWRAGRAKALIAACCIAASLAALLTQHWLLHGGRALQGVYLGDPPFAHLTRAVVAGRLHDWLHERHYIWAPLLLLALLAALWRDLRLVAGVVICLPWLAFSFIARSEQAALMWDYYALPVMVGLCWPLLAGQALAVNGRDARRYAAAQWALAALSTALFVGGAINHDRRPWRSFDPGGWALVARREHAIDTLLAKRATLGRMVVDDRVAALRAGAFSRDELRYGLSFSPAEIAAIDTLVNWPGGWLADRKAALRKAAGLTASAPLLPGSPILLERRPLPVDPADQ